MGREGAIWGSVDPEGMTTIAPHINHSAGWLVLFVLLVVALTLAVAPSMPPGDAATQFGDASGTAVTSVTIRYRSHDGVLRKADLLLPSWYSPTRNPPLPLVISPHGRGGNGTTNATYWGALPTIGGFGVVNPDGMGERLARFSYGYPGQIDDLARMPRVICRALPWVRIDRTRIFALGSSMGGQETLLLVARHPHLLAGAAAMDSVTNMTRRYGQLPLIPGGRDLQTMMAREVGGTPSQVPCAYAARSPLSLARAIAESGVPLQIWWSTKDRIVIDQRHQSGVLFRTVRRLDGKAPVKAYVGSWRHSSEMRSTALLPIALEDFGLLPHGSKPCPPVVQRVGRLA